MATGGIAIPARTTGNLTRNRYQSKIGGNCGPAQPLVTVQALSTTRSFTV